MNWIVQNLWLIPALPLLAAGINALAKQKSKRLSASMAIGSMALSFLLAVWAFAHVLLLRGSGQVTQQVFNFRWFQFGNDWLSLGWVLNPLTAVMLVMVTFVGLLIFIFSVGYMEHDENFTRFFCFLALFAAAMLGEQPATAVHVLGDRGPHLIPPDRFLVLQAKRCGCRKEGVHYDAHWRSSLLPRDGLALLSNGHLAVL
jgi:NADH-quinone oxidoreductase subunit L